MQFYTEINLKFTGDIVCTVLECRLPLLLRKSGNGNGNRQFEVVGRCWMYGIMDGESVLGPFLPHWNVRLLLNHVSGLPGYWNSDTGAGTFEDPRLGPLTEYWESIEQDRTPDDPILFAPHRNKVTGEVINSDPRLLLEALLTRGVKLQEFQLI